MMPRQIYAAWPFEPADKMAVSIMPNDDPQSTMANLYINPAGVVCSGRTAIFTHSPASGNPGPKPGSPQRYPYGASVAGALAGTSGKVSRDRIPRHVDPSAAAMIGTNSLRCVPRDVSGS
jgi:hypothetical protein